jgi:hypothetical protein
MFFTPGSRFNMLLDGLRSRIRRSQPSPYTSLILSLQQRVKRLPRGSAELPFVNRAIANLEAARDLKQEG